MRPVTWVQVIIDQGNIHKNTIILANFKTLNPNLISSEIMRPVTWVQVIIDQGNIHKNTIILANFKTLNPNLISSPVIRPQAFKKPRPLTDMFLDIFVNVNDYTWGRNRRPPPFAQQEYPDMLLQLAYILKI